MMTRLVSFGFLAVFTAAPVAAVMVGSGPTAAAIIKVEPTPTPTSTPTPIPTLQSTEERPSAMATPTGGDPAQLPNTGGVPANGTAGSPYVSLAMAVGGLVLAASGLTAAQLVRRRRS